MKLIIDISEGDYKFIKDLQSLIIGGRGSCKTIQMNVINAIRNGTPYENKGDLISHGTPYETKGDLISRSDLKKAIIELNLDNTSHWSVIHKINIAPTVSDHSVEIAQKSIELGRMVGRTEKAIESQRPRGEWLEDSGNIACSHCRAIWLYRRTDYCPNCGADMRGTI